MTNCFFIVFVRIIDYNLEKKHYQDVGGVHDEVFGGVCRPLGRLP